MSKHKVKTPEEALYHIVTWIHQNHLWEEPTRDTKTIKDMFEQKKGLCHDQAGLLSVLMKATGLPAYISGSKFSCGKKSKGGMRRDYTKRRILCIIARRLDDAFPQSCAAR